MQRLIFSILFIGLALFVVKPAYACSCRIAVSMEEYIDETDVIFYGQALSTKDTPVVEKVNLQSMISMEQLTKFDVVKMWNGTSKEVVSIYHGNGNNCCYCGLVFSPGQYYIVFAHKNQRGYLATSSCTRTGHFPFGKYKNSGLGR